MDSTLSASQCRVKEKEPSFLNPALLCDCFGRIFSLIPRRLGPGSPESNVAQQAKQVRVLGIGVKRRRKLARVTVDVDRAAAQPLGGQEVVAFPEGDVRDLLRLTLELLEGIAKYFFVRLVGARLVGGQEPVEWHGEVFE